ncbi:MAG: alanine racemase [Chitinivibrionales bacterium]|nr:alanine racemase [Chitinivibrionales bacterium]
MFANLPWIDISLDNLLHNLAVIRARFAGEPRPVFAVVKADAYGCGAIPIARALSGEGVVFLVVIRMYEAERIRQAGITTPILVLGECSEDELQYASRYDISVSLNDLSSLAAIRHHPGLRIHCNIDTGMHRMGLMPHETDALLAAIHHGPAMAIEGVFTHLSCADGDDISISEEQIRRFSEVLQKIRQAGYSPRYIHTANSAAALRLQLAPGQCIRSGIALYGCKPDPCQDFGVDLRPILSLKAPVVKVKKVVAGTPVSYSATYHTSEETCIATIPVGYSHGLPRQLSNRGFVLIQGRRYAIAGRITMDYCMVDVGATTTIKPGDEAVFIGTQGDESITPDDIACQCNTIGYEILCGLHRVHRRYFQNGEIVFRSEP